MKNPHWILLAVLIALPRLGAQPLEHLEHPSPTTVIDNKDLPKGLEWGTEVSHLKMAVQVGKFYHLLNDERFALVKIYICNSGNATVDTGEFFGYLHGFALLHRKANGEMEDISPLFEGGSIATMDIPGGHTVVFNLFLFGNILTLAEGKLVFSKDVWEGTTQRTKTLVNSPETVVPKAVPGAATASH